MRGNALLGAALLVGVVAAGSAEGSRDDFSPETMLFDDIPVIVSATRTEQSMLDVPNAVTVLTAEEIRGSGATSLPELLEVVPGLDVMRISRSDVNMSARGFNGPSSSNLLVMVDGRSVYLDFFGAVLWERINVTLDEIERIEVVRGPSSALYGANAFLGTVNIVTKSARDLPSLGVRTGVGTSGGFVDALAARSFGDTAVRTSVSYDVRDHFRNVSSTDPALDHTRDDTGLRSRLFNASLEHDLASGANLRVSGGVSSLKGDLYTSVGTFNYDGPEYHVQLDYERGPWTLRSFMTHLDTSLDTVPAGLPATGVPLDDRIQSNTLDFEVQRRVQMGAHDALLGANTRRLTTDAPDVLGSREAETLYALFVQDRWEITDRVTGFAAARLDDHPKAGLNLSPRISLMYKPSETSRVWAAFSRAFRSPTQVLNYLSLPLQAFVPAPTTLAILEGNESLDPSWSTSYELGFQSYPDPRLNVRADLFYEVISDLTQISVVSGGPPVGQSFRNVGRMTSWGGELWLEFKQSDALRGFASYSFQQANGDYELVTPRHKATAGIRGNLARRLRYALTAGYVGQTDYESTNATTTFPTLGIASRFTLDAFLAYQVVPQLELGVRARNVLHQVREQFPVGDEIGSEVLFTARFEFD